MTTTTKTKTVNPGRMPTVVELGEIDADTPGGRAITDAREWLDQAGPLPTLDDIARPLALAFSLLNDLAERAQDLAFPVSADPSFRAEGDELLALCRAIVNTSSVIATRSATADRDEMGGLMRGVVETILNFQELAHVVETRYIESLED